MKSIDLESQIKDLRSEYRRSDFLHFVRGAGTEIELAERIALLLGCIGEEEHINFSHHSIGNYLAEHQEGDWTYEIDNANQVTLRHWFSSKGSIAVNLTNPPVIITAEDNHNLIEALATGVRTLQTKVKDHH